MFQLALGAGRKAPLRYRERCYPDRSERSLPGREFRYLEAVSVRFVVVTLFVFIDSR